MVISRATEATGSATVGISFQMYQTEYESRAQGRLRIEDGRGHVVLETKSLGLLQTLDGWASFTAYALENGGDRALTVVVDELSPLSPNAKTVYVLDDGKMTYEGVLRKLSLTRSHSSSLTPK
jgi:hypothetical protein